MYACWDLLYVLCLGIVTTPTTMSSQTTPVNSPQPISLSPNQSSKKENLEEKLGSPFEPFNVGNVISSFDDESTKLSQFEGGMVSYVYFKNTVVFVSVRAGRDFRP